MYHILVGHKCDYSGWGEVLVIDENMKNRRDVCAATNAGFIEYKELGSLKSGCQLSPIQGSNYCVLHAPRVSSCFTH